MVMSYPIDHKTAGAEMEVDPEPERMLYAHQQHAPKENSGLFPDREAQAQTRIQTERYRTRKQDEGASIQHMKRKPSRKTPDT